MIEPSTGEVRTREAFLALMWALSYPGRPQLLPLVMKDLRTACGVIADALLDSETTYFSADVESAEAAAHTGARLRAAPEADYAFLCVTSEAWLQSFAELSPGELEYPDRGATAIVLFPAGRPTQRARLTGPGIDGSVEVDIPEVPMEFWDLRRSHIRYPLGVDVFLVCAGAVVGLPRTTEVTVCT